MLLRSPRQKDSDGHSADNNRTGSALHRVLAGLHHAVGAARWMSSRRPSPLLTAAPSRALIDEQISIKGHFLPPHCPVTVCSKMHCDDGDQWEAYAHYTTDADGTVSCEPGSFSRLLEGHVCPSEGQSTELAAVTAERWYMAPGVRRTEIRQNGLVGTLFLPPGPGPFPAMLDLWGMGGGLVEYRSALLASRGYASFTIAYIGHKDLPGPKNCINVDDSYFKSAFHFLQDHYQVCGDRVGIIALSFGTYMCLWLAMQPDVNVQYFIKDFFL